ncbi:MAG: SDR family NAD(P)-dependent oxidoreductase [Cytophagia bacterium]|nr:SDR family NAD(P)-dependent oxidoreductase [Cytophagia bacterium]
MKRVVIIGASSGIGKSLALLYAAQGDLVYITGRRLSLLEDIQRQHPAQIKISAFDVNDLQNDRQLDELVQTLGNIDILVYSSGMGEFNKYLDFGIEKQMIDTNVTAFTQIADWAFNYFQKQGKGSFASITSVAGMMGSRHAPAYNASKAYQINYLIGLRQKIKRLRLPVSFTDLRTGFVDTPMAKAEGKFWVATPEKAARQIHSAINRKARVAYITKRWRIVGFLLKLFA